MMRQGIKNQTGQSRPERHGRNAPIPPEHSNERNRRDQERKPGHPAVSGKYHVQAEPDGQVEHHADHGGGDCR